MKLTDTLDQILRMLLANGGVRPMPNAAGDPVRREAPRPSVADAERPEPLSPATAVVERPAPPHIEPQPDEPARAERARLETTADAAERLGLGFHLGAAVDRIATAAGEGSDGAPKLREAAWLIERYLELLERRPTGADLHATMMRLAREGDTIAGLRALAAALESDPERALPAREDAPSESPPEEPPAVSDPAPPSAAAPAHVPLRRELLVMSVRTTMIVLAVVAVVALLTLIAQWR